jgi:hypothetical protein
MLASGGAMDRETRDARIVMGVYLLGWLIYFMS